MPPEPPSVPMWLDLASERLRCGARPWPCGPKPSPSCAIWWPTLASYSPKRLCWRPSGRDAGEEAGLSVCVSCGRRWATTPGHPALSRRCTGAASASWAISPRCPAAPHTSSPAPLPLLAGRERELDALHGALATARTGDASSSSSRGRPGSAKPRWSRRSSRLWRRLGRSGSGAASASTITGPGRPIRRCWRPWDACAEAPGGPEVVALLGQQAPTWLVQMPGLVQADDLETLQRRSAGATQDRMLWELAEALERDRAPAAAAGARRPALERPSTLDLLAVLARRREPARLLLLGTYRSPTRCSGAIRCRPSTTSCSGMGSAWNSCSRCSPKRPWPPT